MSQPAAPPIEHKAPATWLLVLAYITVSIAWGTTYGGIKVAVETFPPFTMAAIRFITAGVVMVAVFRAMGIPLPRREDWRHLALVGFLLLTCANGLLSYAEQYVESAFAALMVNTAPFVFVGLAAWNGEKISRRAWLGLVLGFGGVLVLVSPDLREALSGSAILPPQYWFAILALVVGPTCWAVGSFLNNRRPARCHPLMSASVQTLLGGIGAGIVAIVSGDIQQLTAPSGRSMLAIAYLIVIGSFLGYIAYNYCTMHLPPARTATIIYLNMVVAVLVGTLLLGERLTVEMLIGGAVVLFGVFLVNSGRRKKIIPQVSREIPSPTPAELRIPPAAE